MNSGSLHSRNPRPLSVAILTAAALLCAIGCGNKEKPANTARSPSPEAPKPAGHARPSTAVAKIKFKNGAGDTVFSIKRMDDGAKLVDGKEVPLARFKLEGEKLKVKDPQEKTLGYVIGTGVRFRIKDAEQEIVLFELQRQDDGDWKLEDGAESLIYKIKKREYGFEIEDASDNSLAKIKVKGDKTSLRDPAEKTILSTKDPVDPAAVSCLGLDKIDSLPLRCALFFRVLDGGSK